DDSSAFWREMAPIERFFATIFPQGLASASLHLVQPRVWSIGLFPFDSCWLGWQGAASLLTEIEVRNAAARPGFAPASPRNLWQNMLATFWSPSRAGPQP